MGDNDDFSCGDVWDVCERISALLGFLKIRLR